MDFAGLTSDQWAALVAPGLVLALLLAVLISGRAPLARTFTGFYAANRRDTPALYWTVVLLYAEVAATVCWWTARSLGLIERLPSGLAATAERVAPAAALAVLAIFAVLVLVLERRRRARLRAAHPSAVERASGGV